MTDERADLRGEWTKNREALVEDVIKIHEMLARSVETRIAFFERLVLVAAGSFALTFTFLSYLRGHLSSGDALHGLGYLKAAWGSLLLCIISAGLHNIHRCNELERFSTTISSQDTAIRRT